jgi:hypothetical protein
MPAELLFDAERLHPFAAPNSTGLETIDRRRTRASGGFESCPVRELSG